MRRVFALVLFVICFETANSQELLNASIEQIKKSMDSSKAVLKLNKILPRNHNFLVYTFSKTDAEKKDIVLISFSLNENKCYRYVVKYLSDKKLKSLIDKFNSPSSGYKKVGKGLLWRNYATNGSIEILDLYRNGEKIHAFVLEIYNKNEF